MSIRTRIVLGLALAGLVAGQAMADNVKVNTPDTSKITDEVNGLVLNGQLNNGDLFSDLDANISNVKGDASATSAAIGNSLSVTLAGTHTTSSAPSSLTKSAHVSFGPAILKMPRIPPSIVRSVKRAMW